MIPGIYCQPRDSLATWSGIAARAFACGVPKQDVHVPSAAGDAPDAADFAAPAVRRNAPAFDAVYCRADSGACAAYSAAYSAISSSLTSVRCRWLAPAPRTRNSTPDFL